VASQEILEPDAGTCTHPSVSVNRAIISLNRTGQLEIRGSQRPSQRPANAASVN